MIIITTYDKEVSKINLSKSVRFFIPPAIALLGAVSLAFAAIPSTPPDSGRTGNWDSVAINTSNGGSITLTGDAKAKITITSYAFPKDGTAFIRKLVTGAPKATTGLKLVSDVYELAAEDNLNKGMNQFNKEVTIQLPYDSGKLGSTATSAMSIYYLAAGGKWTALPSTVNTGNKTVTAKSKHFTDFAVLASTGGVLPNVGGTEKSISLSSLGLVSFLAFVSLVLGYRLKLAKR